MYSRIYSKLYSTKITWHDLRSCPEDTPRETGWYLFKVKSSDDLRLVYGFEEVTAETADLWARIDLTKFSY